ncbi:MAG: ribonuclease PH [Atopobiaceae bacterium]|nr:ribonuclease PH [Atopobiaceae bacterium]
MGGLDTANNLSAHFQRKDGRAPDELRKVSLTRNVMKNALGSCLCEFGDTRVLCAATIDESLPAWRKNAHAGWVTAEYAMLPASTGQRTKREYNGRKGRSMEIERLIGRSLRAVCNLRALGECCVTVDCDVLQADGGTRTASITGAWVALHDALCAWVDAGKIRRLPLTGQVAAVSFGIVDGQALLDLNYPEDSHAEVDMNLVATDDGNIVELQGTGERICFSRQQLDGLLDLGQAGIEQLIALQNDVTHFRS